MSFCVNISNVYIIIFTLGWCNWTQMVGRELAQTYNGLRTQPTSIFPLSIPLYDSYTLSTMKVHNMLVILNMSISRVFRWKIWSHRFERGGIRQALIAQSTSHLLKIITERALIAALGLQKVQPKNKQYIITFTLIMILNLTCWINHRRPC